MTDFHTHILPGMDDGSRSTDESGKMLCILRREGVDKAVLSPHFYPDRENPVSFLRRRDESLARLARLYDPEVHPAVYAGTEVAFFPGISDSEYTAELCIRGTDCLMIEMPFRTWSEPVLDELFELKERRNLRIVIAHYERYMQKSHVIGSVLSAGIMLQSNAEAFEDKSTRSAMLKLLNEDKIGLLGTDCHNTTSRPPYIIDAVDCIRKACGERALMKFDRNSAIILRNAVPAL